MTILMRLGCWVGVLGLFASLAAPLPAAAQSDKAAQDGKKRQTKTATTQHTKGKRRSGDHANRSVNQAQSGSSGGLKVVPMSQGGAPTRGVPAPAGPAAAPGGAPPAGAPGAPNGAPAPGPAGAPGGPPPGGPGGAPPGGLPPMPSGTMQIGGPAPSGSMPAMSPGGMITMDFRGSDIANVLKFFAMAAGWQVVPDASLTGPVTIISPKPLTLDQAFQVLQSTLEVRGFSGQLEKRGEVSILKIVPLERAVQSTTLISKDPNGGSPDELKNQVITQVIPIENVDAGTLGRELRELINKGASLVASTGTNALIVTDTANNVRRIVDLVGVLDKTASNTDIRIFQLKHADATDVSNAITNLFRQMLSRGRGSGAAGQPGQPGQPGMVVNPGGQPGQPAASADRAAIIATPDTRTNSVLVVASTDNMKRAEEIINKLDDAQSSALQTKVIKLQYTDSDAAADTINSVLSGTTPQRSSSGFGGGASFFARVFGGGGMGGGGGTQSSNPFAKVVSNARTNSLIATATDEWMTRIDDLVKELDVQVKSETTTFVIPLKNAQAQDLASVLSQAFGTGSSGGGYYNPYGGGYSIFGTPNTQRANRQAINRRQTSSSRAAATSRAAAAGSASQPGAVVHGTMTSGGFIPDGQATAEAEEDAPDSRQFVFGGYGGYGYGRGQQGTPQYGRGAQGNYVNLLQLRQNVGVTADLGSNSLVITTTPDNLTAIREIIESLDIVPRQVMIEVIIAEATLDSAQKLGFQFDAKGIGKILGTGIAQSGSSNFPLGTAGTASSNISSPIQPGAQYGIQADNGRFNALVQALNTDSKVRVLSTPKVFTSNNQQATIDIVTHVPYATSSYTGGLNVGSSVSYSYLDLGVTLDVTPRITNDGRVTIDVMATTSDLVGFDSVQQSVDTSGRVTNTPAPRWSERSTDTSVSVKDGEIVALGGMMRENTNISANKVPLLGDIPLLGSLFRSTTRTTGKTELMIFMVPHVVDAERDVRTMVEQQSTGIRTSFPQLDKDYPFLKPQAPLAPNGSRKPVQTTPPTDQGGQTKP